MCSTVSLSLASGMIISWYIAVVLGYFLTNFIRILLISYLAPIIFENIQNNIACGYGPKTSGMACLYYFFFVP